MNFAVQIFFSLSPKLLAANPDLQRATMRILNPEAKMAGETLYYFGLGPESGSLLFFLQNISKTLNRLVMHL